MRTIVGIVGLALLLGCGAGGPEPEPTGTWQEEMTRARPAYEALAAIAANYPSNPVPTACANDPGNYLTLSWNKLMHITGGPKSDPQSTVAVVALSTDQARIGRLTPPGETPKYPRAATYREAMDELERRTHMGVVRVEHAQAATLQGGRSFRGGHLVGWLVVFELSSRQPVCQWPIAATSSETIHYQTKVGASSRERDAEKRQAVQKDLKRELATSIREARKKLWTAPTE